MDKAIFCYKIWGAAIDEDNNPTWAYAQTSINGDGDKPVEIVSEADYKNLHEHFRKQIASFNGLSLEEVICISLEQYEHETIEDIQIGVDLSNGSDCSAEVPRPANESEG